MKKKKYKGFTIIVREQKPNVSYPMTDKARDKLYKKLNADEIFGSHSYEILNKKGKQYMKIITKTMCGKILDILMIEIIKLKNHSEKNN